MSTSFAILHFLTSWVFILLLSHPSLGIIPSTPGISMCLDLAYMSVDHGKSQILTKESKGKKYFNKGNSLPLCLGPTHLWFLRVWLQKPGFEQWSYCSIFCMSFLESFNHLGLFFCIRDLRILPQNEGSTGLGSVSIIQTRVPCSIYFPGIVCQFGVSA